MNWKLIFLFSLIAITMGFGTVYFIPLILEPFCWIGMFVLCVFIVARFSTGKYFLNGLMAGILNNLWIAVIHYVFFEAYLLRHPAWATMEYVTAEQIRRNDLIFSPVLGILNGLFLGLFAWVASLLLRKTSTTKES